MTKYNIDNNDKFPLSRKVRKIYLPVGFIGFLIAITIWYAMSTGSQIAKQYHPLVDAAIGIKLETTLAHLWFEGIMSGDKHEDIEEVWLHINKAEWYANAMLSGGQDDNNIYIPLDDPKLRQDILQVLEKIRAFRNIAKERYANINISSTGSDFDQRFDVVFNTFLEQADEVKTDLQQVIKKNINRFQFIQTVLIILSLIVTAIVGLMLNRYEHKQAINLLMLKATNQQLMASEQQLKATNQQLMASEQQLKASNQQLLQSLQKLALHVQQTPLGVIQWDLNWKVTEWNKAAEKIFGFNSEEAIGQHAANLIIPESVKPVVNKVWTDLLAQKGGNRSTNENITKNNETIICEWYNTPLIDENGETIGVASLVMDITKRMQAEKALNESENKYRTLFEQSADAVLIIEEDKFVDCNQATVKMLGYTNMDELLKTHPSLLSPQVQPDGRSSFEKANEMMSIAYDQGSHRFEWDHKRRNGEVFPVEVLLTPIPFGERNFLHVVWRDITERKRAEQNSEDLANILEKSLNEIYFFDAKTFNFIQVNYGARENIGYTIEELKKLTPLDIKPNFTKESFLELIKPLIDKTEEIITFETIHQRKNGSHYDAEVHLQLTEFLDKPVFVAIILDITETNRLQKLESRAERLEMAGTIAGQVAHDFNNLLGPIMAYPELIRDEIPHDHKSRAYLDDIENAANKIANINQDLLTMGRRGHYNQDVLNLNRIVLQTAKEMDLRSKTIISELDLSEDLMNIKGGSAQIHRLLTNLMVNAQDAMQNIGKISIKTENYYANDTTISFGRVPKGEYVKLTITDTGCGIPDNIIQKILDPFFSTKTTNKERGSGLGLSVVDAVVKDHNGYLDLSSKVGQGTSFYIYFPITREDFVASETYQTAFNGSEKILVVDDDQIQRDVAAILLNKLGYIVNTVESGEKAVEFIKQNPQDLLILDMVMPGGIDGAETYQRILEICPNQKAIILSGFSETDRVIEVQKLGAGAFVRKPITKNIIAAAVRTELDRPGENSQS